MANEVYNYLDFGQLARLDGVINLDEELIMIDSESYVQDHLTFSLEKLFCNYPVKVSFTVVVFCSKGTMNYNVNLLQYQLSRDDILVLQEGDIVEYIGRSDDLEVSVIAFNKKGFLDSRPHGSRHVDEKVAGHLAGFPTA